MANAPSANRDGLFIAVCIFSFYQRPDYIVFSSVNPACVLMHRQLAIDALLKVTQGYTGIPSRSLLASAEIDERYPEKLFIIAVPKILRMAGSPASVTFRPRYELSTEPQRLSWNLTGQTGSVAGTTAIVWTSSAGHGFLKRKPQSVFLLQSESFGQVFAHRSFFRGSTRSSVPGYGPYFETVNGYSWSVGLTNSVLLSFEA